MTEKSQGDDILFQQFLFLLNLHQNGTLEVMVQLNFFIIIIILISCFVGYVAAVHVCLCLCRFWSSMEECRCLDVFLILFF